MAVDYRSLYVNDYFGHNEGAVSFPGHFPQSLAAIASDLRNGLVLDVGAGNNELVRRLRPFGLEGFSLDLRGDEAKSVLAFDLTQFDPSLCRTVKEKLAAKAPGASHMTTCLDVLEHVDRKDLATAIWNLRELASEWLLVSISTRPSSAYNLYHASVMPKRSWRQLLAAAGFEVVPHDRLSDLASCRVYPEHDESCWSVNQWRRADPFRDAADPESYFLLLRRGQRPVDRADFAEAASRLLGLDEKSGVRKVVLDSANHLVFLLVHYQDFLQYVPYWEALPSDSFTVLMPEDAFHGLGVRREKALMAWMRTRGITPKRVTTVGDFDWKGLPGSRRALISASESTASTSHLLSAAFVLEARSQGVVTFQLQHGIWPHASFPDAVHFLSEYVLTWSRDFEEGFQSSRPRNHFLVKGCAKFDDYARPRSASLADILGEWVETYRHKILVATNLHWPMHHRGAEVMPRLIETAREMPDTLFVCKLHPVHDLTDSSLPETPPNLLILDEFACLFGGISTSQLVIACDAVVGTLTSVVLEAALAGRPFVVLDTGNPNRFQGVEPIPVASMGEAIGRMIADGPAEADRAFRDHYFAPENFGKSLDHLLAAIEEKLAIAPAESRPIAGEALRAYSRRYADFAMEMRPARMHGLEQQTKADRVRIASLLGDLQCAGDYCTALNRDMAQLQSDVSQLHKDADQLRADSAQLRDDAEQLRKDGDQLRGDADQLRGDATLLRGDADQLRGDAARIREVEVELRETVARQTRELEEKESSIACLEERAALVGRLSQDVAHIRIDLARSTEQVESNGLRIANLEAQTLRDAELISRLRADIERSQTESESLKAMLVPFHEIGPVSLGIARKAQRISHRFPRLSARFKKIVDR